MQLHRLPILSIFTGLLFILSSVFITVAFLWLKPAMILRLFPFLSCGGLLVLFGVSVLLRIRKHPRFRMRVGCETIQGFGMAFFQLGFLLSFLVFTRQGVEFSEGVEMSSLQPVIWPFVEGAGAAILGIFLVVVLRQLEDTVFSPPITSSPMRGLYSASAAPHFVDPATLDQLEKQLKKMIEHMEAQHKMLAEHFKQIKKESGETQKNLRELNENLRTTDSVFTQTGRLVETLKKFFLDQRLQ